MNLLAHSQFWSDLPRTKAAILFLSFFSAASLLLIFLLSTPTEPRYQERRLSSWLAIYVANSATNADPVAVTAITQIGTNALPFLLSWIQYEPRPHGPKNTIWKLVHKLPQAYRPTLLLTWAEHDERRADTVTQAFKLLGPQARQALPQLVRMMSDKKHPDAGFRAQLAAACVGEEATPYLIAAALRDRGQHLRTTAPNSHLSTNQLFTNMFLRPGDKASTNLSPTASQP